MIGAVGEWFSERIPISGDQLRELTNEPVPNHLKRWWFCLGGTPAYLFVVQIVTGILLAFYYKASPSEAYESVRYITEEAAYGWYLRGLHKWAATLMIASIILHQMRVFFTGAYRKPRELTNEPVPNHLKRWWFCLGGTPAYLFVVQIVTGILLAFYYKAAPSEAYESVRYITEEASYGWYLRGLHKWAATLMIASIILHQMRVFFTGAYRKPRELNWMIGMCLLMLTLVVGFTGYSLVYEQLSYWGATVGANIAGTVPVAGDFIRRMMLAGDAYNDRTLSRFFIFHAAVLPFLMVVLLAIHITLIRLQGVTEFKFEDEPESESDHFNFFPDHFMTELAIGLVLMILLTALAITIPVTMGPPADPLVTPEVIKPEWFFYVTFRWLKLFTGTVAVLSMGFVVFLMFVWPLIDAAIRRRWPRSELSVWVGILVVFGIIGLTVWEAAVEH